MSNFDPADRNDDHAFAAVVAENIPARRLLAHDLEPLSFEDDGETELPPPD